MAAERFDYLGRADELFKIKYMKLSMNVYNSANVLLGRVKKSFDFTGKQKLQAVPLGFAGGVGSGTIPSANTANYDDAVLLSKKVYAKVEIDRESIKASLDGEGAFVEATKEVVKKGVESWMRNMSRILFGSGDGSLGAGNDTGTNVTGDGSSGTPYVIEIGSATFKEANWEERDLVNINSETTALEIVAVDPDNRLISLEGTSARLAALTGVEPFVAADIVYMQGSKDNDPEGLKSVLDATSGTLYSIPVTRRWKAEQVAAGGASISPDLMNKVMLQVEKKCGKVPNLIITSFLQVEKLQNILEDQKRYPLSPRDKNLKGKFSFMGLEFMSSRGPVGIFAERFCEDDRMYFLNDNHIEIHHRPDFGWFDDDGTVFLRTGGSIDAYDAVYGGYLQVYIQPSFHGVLTGLAL